MVSLLLDLAFTRGQVEQDEGFRRRIVKLATPFLFCKFTFMAAITSNIHKGMTDYLFPFSCMVSNYQALVKKSSRVALVHVLQMLSLAGARLLSNIVNGIYSLLQPLSEGMEST